MCKQKNRCDQKLDLQFILFSQTRNSILVLYNMAGEFFFVKRYNFLPRNILLSQHDTYNSSYFMVVPCLRRWPNIEQHGVNVSWKHKQ